MTDFNGEPTNSVNGAPISPSSVATGNLTASGTGSFNTLKFATAERTDGYLGATSYRLPTTTPSGIASLAITYEPPTPSYIITSASPGAATFEMNFLYNGNNRAYAVDFTPSTTYEFETMLATINAGVVDFLRSFSGNQLTGTVVLEAIDTAYPYFVRVTTTISGTGYVSLSIAPTRALNVQLGFSAPFTLPTGNGTGISASASAATQATTSDQLVFSEFTGLPTPPPTSIQAGIIAAVCVPPSGVAGFVEIRGDMKALNDIFAVGDVDCYLLNCADIQSSGLADLENMTAVTASSTTANFVAGQRVQSIGGAVDYILPQSAPPNDGNTYGIGNQPAQSTITTPATGSVFSMDLQYFSDPVERVDVQFLPSTILGSEFVFSQINQALSEYFDRKGSPRFIVFSLDTASFPYRTRITIPPNPYSISVFVSGASNVGPLMGWGSSSPFYIVSVNSPAFSTFTQLGIANPQLTWTALAGAGGSGGVGSRIQNATDTVYVECEAAAVDVVGNLVASADVQAQTLTLAELAPQPAPAAGFGRIYANAANRLEYVTSTMPAESLAYVSDIPGIPDILRAPDGNAQAQTGDGGVTVIFNNSTGTSVFSSSISAGTTGISSPNAAATMSVDDVGDAIIQSVGDVVMTFPGLLMVNTYSIPGTLGTVDQVLTSDGIDTASWQTPKMGLFSQVANASVTNTTAETSIISTAGAAGTRVLPAGFFTTGSAIAASLGGATIDTQGAGQSLRLRVRIGGTTVCDTGVQGLPNIAAPIAWTMRVNATYTGAQIVANIVFGYGTTGARIVSSGVGAVTTGIANTFDVTATWGAASAGNIITSSYCVLNRTY